MFSSSTGTAYDLSSGATVLFEGEEECNGRNIDDASSLAANIGFTFTFDDVDYTKFSASTNGLIGLFRSWGTTAVSSCWTNELTATSGLCFGNYGATLDSIPQLAPLWDDQRVPGECNDDGFNGEIRYKLFGSSPNRVLVIEWLDTEFDYYNYQYTTYQARLYEGSNKIEFWYAGFDASRYGGDGASIGIVAVRATSFQSVTPGSPATVSTSSANDRVDPLDIAENTLYTFSPCAPRFSGNIAQGGTAAMTSGDSLFASKTVQVGSTASYTPFTISMPFSGCPSVDYSFEITGAYADDYTITPSSGTLSSGESVTPTITVTPDCAGRRPALLRVRMSDGGERLFTIAPTATPQAGFTGNIAQGGTATVASGDTLMSNVIINRGLTASVQPLTITNTNVAPSSTPLAVSFELIDPTNQYSISTTGTSLAAGASISPTITFTPVGVAAQEATLVVTAGCDVRTYMLRAFSAAPGGVLISDGVQLDSTVALWPGQSSCVGLTNALPITVQNTGNGPFLITGISIYRTDTTVMQGTAPYALLRDANNQPIPSRDYMLMLGPGTAPLTPEQALALPFSVPEGTSRTIYVVFVGQEAGRRYARAYVQTNGLNHLGTDINGVAVEGLLRFDLMARAVGAQLASGPEGRALKPVVLPSVAVDDTSTTTFTVHNSGACDLLIRRDKLRIITGDVNEFALLDVLPSTPIDAATESYRIAPGASDRITVRFTPSRSGTRMATLLVQTNDSSIWLPGISERGAHRVDLYGFGRAGLDATPLVLAPVLVGGTVSGVATLENSSTVIVEVRSITIVGEDAAQFSASAAQPWPALPAQVAPGSKLKLGVDLTPTGEAGARRAAIEVVTMTNDTIIVPIRGEAGIATLVVAPASLFDNVQLTVGTYIRQTVMITNTGTFPIRLGQPVITGTDASNYSLGAMPRLDLTPGQTEYLEVTYEPQSAGTSSATLEIPSSVGLQTVQLGGMATGVNDEKDPTERTGGQGSRDGVRISTGAVGHDGADAVGPAPATTRPALR